MIRTGTFGWEDYFGPLVRGAGRGGAGRGGAGRGGVQDSCLHALWAIPSSCATFQQAAGAACAGTCRQAHSTAGIWNGNITAISSK